MAKRSGRARKPKQPNRAPPTPRLSASEQLERQLVQAALAKIRSNEKPTSAETAALKRFERKQEEERRWEHYHSIPLKHWREMAGGLQVRQVKDQAELYGIPFGERVIDLPAVVRALHKFLADYAYVIASAKNAEGEGLMQGVSTPALEEWRKEQAQIARLKRLQLEGELLPHGEIQRVLTEMTRIWQRHVEQMQQLFGPQARELAEQAIDELQHVIEQGDATEEP